MTRSGRCCRHGRQPGAGHQPPASDRTGRRPGDQPRHPAARGGRRLLTRLAARPGLSAGDAAVGEITRLCGYLPLAIGLLGRQLHHHPAWTAAEPGRRAGRGARPAGADDCGEPVGRRRLRPVLPDLTGSQQRLFRRLGLHPGTDIDAYAAAALDGIDLGAARRGLGPLRPVPADRARHGRYRFHDLIREHARALAATDPAAEARPP